MNLPQTVGQHNTITNAFTDYSELTLNDTMTCQELLAFSGVISVALPTGNRALDSFYSNLKKQSIIPVENSSDGVNSGLVTTNIPSALSSSHQHGGGVGGSCGGGGVSNYIEDFSCCYDLHQATLAASIAAENKKQKKSKFYSMIITVYKVVSKIFRFIRKYVQLLVDHKYFQQGILLAILINTLSMGIEYHNQPDYLTVAVETSNIVFSAIFAVEMLLKIIADGPLKYVANGFNVFDGIIVILR